VPSRTPSFRGLRPVFATFGAFAPPVFLGVIWVPQNGLSTRTARLTLWLASKVRFRKNNLTGRISELLITEVGVQILPRNPAEQPSKRCLSRLGRLLSILHSVQRGVGWSRGSRWIRAGRANPQPRYPTEALACRRELTGEDDWRAFNLIAPWPNPISTGLTTQPIFANYGRCRAKSIASGAVG